jgi:hypothetical protein
LPWIRTTSDNIRTRSDKVDKVTGPASAGLPPRDPSFGVVLEEEAVEDLHDDLLLAVVEPGEGFELEPELVVGAALKTSKGKLQKGHYLTLADLCRSTYLVGSRSGTHPWGRKHGSLGSVQGC